MPLYETPPEAVDRVYAESLFALADAEGGRERLEQLSGELDELIELARQNPDLSEFFASRLLAPEDRERSINAMFEGRLTSLLLRFLHVLNRKERMMRLLSVVAAFQEMVQSKFGRVEVDVYTKTPLNPDQLASISRQLQAALSREPIVYPYTDDTMLGGVRMQIGDRLFDDSIRTQLRNLTERLKVTGGANMRANAQRAIAD